jgi:sugar lactone lactonase YvrE
MSEQPELWWQQDDSLLPESPVWLAAEQAFYWVDIAARRIRRHDGSARPARSWTLPQKIGCIAPRAGGGFIAALQDGVYAVTLDAREAQAGLRLLAAAPHGQAPLRFNDGRCDRQGRFWVGSMHDEPGAERRPLGALACLEATRWQPAFQTGMLVPNGLAFAPDGRRMYFSDSHASRAQVWVCDYDIESGRPGAPQLFIPALPAGRPDGAAVDAEGGYWICANDGAAVFRYRPDGRLDRRIELPVSKPTMCAFGGADLRLLLIATMKPEGAPPRDELDGALFAVQLDIPGLTETPCQQHTQETKP